MGQVNLFAFMLFVLTVGCPCLAQKRDSTSEGLLEYQDAGTQTWDFGLELQARSNVRGIVATVPIPVDWPEQSIKVIDSKKTPDVSHVRFKSLGGTVKQMSFTFQD